MRAVEFNLKDPEFGAELVDVEEPRLPNGEWARVAVTVGGICGSDLHLFGNKPLRAPALGGFWTFPFLVGHEIAGRVVEAGADCDIPVGTRVAVDPVLACVVRGIEPVCRMCASGRESCCLELGSQVFTPGMSIGFTMGLGGGWAEQVLGHRSMLHAIPDAVPDKIASLHEPVSIAVHALQPQATARRRSRARGGRRDHRARGSRGRARLVPRVRSDRHRASRVPGPGRARRRRGSCRALAGSQRALRGARDARRCEGERPRPRADAPRRLSLRDRGGRRPRVGDRVDPPGRQLGHGDVHRRGRNGGGRPQRARGSRKPSSSARGTTRTATIRRAATHHSIDLALEVLANGGLPESTVTHEFALEELRDAVAVAIDKTNSHAVKVVFRP